MSQQKFNKSDILASFIGLLIILIRVYYYMSESNNVNYNSNLKR
ncbi:hypothetical protein SCAPIOD180010 [Staphylococcus capitis]|nr:hypothetical protein CR01_180010 [Staphylococcus capitis CR01]CQD26546.1 hypothetical protein SCAPIOD120081 [Staphylococcus capitis]CQD27469.1 hypothetical protein SCAPIOD180010 [Staphylococcus capitis]CQD31101.1 hypothetical protein SCAPIOD150014 [Staphylococcus capitis]CRN11140.1 hypothetical protein BN1517170010 [Staphylococcus capitis]